MNGLSSPLRGVCGILLWCSLSALAEDTGQNGTATSQTASGVSAQHDYWAVEDSKEREKLPLYKVIPAAKPDELTPANGYPKPETFLTWHHALFGAGPD